MGLSHQRILKKYLIKYQSFSKRFSKEDLKILEKIINYLDLEKNFNVEFSAELKRRWNISIINLSKGKFVTGLSRGDGKEGEDITKNLKTIKISLLIFLKRFS